MMSRPYPVLAAALVTVAVAAAAACQSPADGQPDAGRGKPPASQALASRSFLPVADARVEQGAAASNFGTSTRLVIDGSPLVRSYLRFEVAGLVGQVTSARLRMFVIDATSDGPAVYATGTGWSEGGLTWANQPGPAGPRLADLGAASVGTWVELDVTPLVAGDGTVSLVLIPTSSSGMQVSSRQGSNPPQLIVTTEDQPCVDCPPVPVATLEADATVDRTRPTTNLGGATTIAADASPALEGYLRFRVSGVGASPLAGVNLRLTVTNATGDAPALYLADNGWSESTVTWNNRPGRDAIVRADVAAVAQGTVADYDLTSLVTADGVYTFALISTSTDGFAAASRESGTPPVLTLTARPHTGDGFSFTAVGDHGSTANSSAVFDLMPRHGEWAISLGDLSYGDLAPESTWCAYVRSRIGQAYPLAIVAGNHEGRAADGDGVIDNFVAPGCLPDRMTTTGDYGKQYYFDYPADAPLLRTIAISPQTRFDVGGFHDYAPGGARYAWVAETIDGARAAGIPWVVVASHKNCVTMGTKTCELGAGLFNLLVEKKVDLLLQGHDHTYQRGKQIALGPACASITPGSYRAGCVVDDGADGDYAAGAGTVLVISGAGGHSLDPIAPNDSEAGYFARAMTTPNTYGVTRVIVTSSRLEVDFVRAAGGDFADHFTIEK